MEKNALIPEIFGEKTKIFVVRAEQK